MLVNMKMSSKKDQGTLLSTYDDKPEYPYGLRITLDDESLAKLMFDDLPGVGEKFMFHVHVEVTDVHQSESQDGGPQRSVTFQITDMEFSSPKEMSPEQTATKFYVEAE